MSILNSKLFKDLENGILPKIDVAIESQSIITLSITLIISAVIIILISKLLKNL